MEAAEAAVAEAAEAAEAEAAVAAAAAVGELLCGGALLLGARLPLSVACWYCGTAIDLQCSTFETPVLVF